MLKRKVNEFDEESEGEGSENAQQAVAGLVKLVTNEVLGVLAQQGVGSGKKGRGSLGPHPKRKPRGQVQCWNCNGWGHMARDCKEEVICFRCGGRGHIIAVCSTPPTPDLRTRLNKSCHGKMETQSSETLTPASSSKGDDDGSGTAERTKFVEERTAL